jgi:hypothetical protein
MYVRYVQYTSHRAQAAGTYLSFWLAAPRGAADIYVSLCVFWPYLTNTGNAPFGQSHLQYAIHLSAILLPPPCCLVRP